MSVAAVNDLALALYGLDGYRRKRDKPELYGSQAASEQHDEVSYLAGSTPRGHSSAASVISTARTQHFSHVSARCDRFRAHSLED